jgi:drug/metabolite transporter (DMT)-like permease
MAAHAGTARDQKQPQADYSARNQGVFVMIESNVLRGIVLTTLAMLAFAGNSILCRMALADGLIDPATFGNIRLLSGAITLLVLLAIKSGVGRIRRHGSWLSALMLFLYVLGFSYAYIDLQAGTGALILFGMVQATMIIAAVAKGDRPTAIELLGWVCAVTGLIFLVLPGVGAPSAIGSVLMGIAGIAWGLYSIRGQAESDPVASTASNFLRSVAFIPFVFVATLQSVQLTTTGVVLALLSGVITSGIGYVLWYAAITRLKTIQAALVQLSVPAIAALGGVALLGEPLSRRLIISSGFILGGISIALARKSRSKTSA